VAPSVPRRHAQESTKAILKRVWQTPAAAVQAAARKASARVPETQRPASEARA